MKRDYLNSGANIGIKINYELRIINYFCKIKKVMQFLDLQTLRIFHRLL